MKGIITAYKEDKGFGFLKDENEVERFFHISQVRDKQTFLNNITDYLFTDWLERTCYIVEFDPKENEKGLNARNIKLTGQVFNVGSSTSEFAATVTKISYEVESLTRITSGVRKGMGKPLGATQGGNGTYRLGYPETYRDLMLHFRRTDDIGWGIIEIRELALHVNDRSKVTDKFVQQLSQSLVGKSLQIGSDGEAWMIMDRSELRLT